MAYKSKVYDKERLEQCKTEILRRLEKYGSFETDSTIGFTASEQEQAMAELVASKQGKSCFPVPKNLGIVPGAKGEPVKLEDLKKMGIASGTPVNEEDIKKLNLPSLDHLNSTTEGIKNPD